MDIKSFMAKNITETGRRYAADLAAIPTEDWGICLSGTARSPLDFTFEIINMNRRIATRLRGEVPPAMPQEGWVKCTDEFAAAGTTMASFLDSMDEVLTAWNALTDDQLNDVIEFPDGNMTKLDYGMLCAWHLSYHDGQLTYIQSLKGDSGFYW